MKETRQRKIAENNEEKITCDKECDKRDKIYRVDDKKYNERYQIQKNNQIK